MGIRITQYNAICNLGSNIDEIYQNAVNGVSSCFKKCGNDIFGVVDEYLPQIANDNYNIRCNQLALKALSGINVNSIITKYGTDNIAVIVATTNTGVNEYEKSCNPKHAEISNTAEFIQQYYGLKNFYTSVSTACSSGIKAFSIAVDLLRSNYAKAVVVVATDSIAKVPTYGFRALEILSTEKTNPFAKKRNGINLGEGAAAFIVENSSKGIKIAGIGETTDIFHITTPDPTASDAICAIRYALNEAKMSPSDIDYINLHGTGTFANDLMEAQAINTVFGEKTPASSTKPLTGHCLGAAAGIEAALCCKLLEQGQRVFPHIYNGDYDDKIPKINLVKKNNSYIKVQNCLCTSFGFGGTNCAMILRRDDNAI